MTGNNHSLVNGSIPGSGQPWRQQYHINNLQSSDITEWSTGKPLLSVLGNSQAVVTKDRVYLLSGYNGVKWVPFVYSALIGIDGTLSPWYVESLLPDALGYSSAIAIKNKLYLLGGVNSDWVSVPTVYTASISKSGVLWGWTTGTPLPDALSHSSAIVTKNRIYLLGGYNGIKWVPVVYTALINDDGTLGEWTIGKPLPDILGKSQAIITKNRVYLLGGFNGSIWVPTVYTASINDDGTLGEWTIGTPLPSALGYSSSIVTKGRVYLLGGVNRYWGYVPTVYTASINDDGMLGEWSTGTPLPDALSNSSIIIIKNRVYLLGGHNGSTWASTVYTASIAGGLDDYSAYYS